jgi:hypothetical protein
MKNPKEIMDAPFYTPEVSYNIRAHADVVARLQIEVHP